MSAFATMSSLHVSPLVALAATMAGLATGLAYFWLLHRTVRVLTGAAPRGRAWALSLARVVLAVAAFWLLARQGALPLLLGFAGFLAARPLVRRWAEDAR